MEYKFGSIYDRITVHEFNTNEANKKYLSLTII